MNTLIDTVAEALSHSFERIMTVLAVLGSAILGRLMFHADQVKKGKRRFWSQELAMDMIIAACMGLITYGGCIWAGLTGPPQAAVIAAMGYLGPHVIDFLYGNWKRGRGDSAPANDTELDNDTEARG